MAADLAPSGADFDPDIDSDFERHVHGRDVTEYQNVDEDVNEHANEYA